MKLSVLNSICFIWNVCDKGNDCFRVCCYNIIIIDFTFSLILTIISFSDFPYELNIIWCFNGASIFLNFWRLSFLIFLFYRTALSISVYIRSRVYLDIFLKFLSFLPCKFDNHILKLQPSLRKLVTYTFLIICFFSSSVQN